MQNRLEQKVRRYIKFKKFFMFSDAMIVTELTKNSLSNILKKLIAEGLIVQDKDSNSIMNSSYVVLSRYEKIRKVEDIKEKKLNIEFIRSLEKVINIIEDEKLEEINYLVLLQQSKISRGTFARIVKVMIEQDILKNIDTNTYEVNSSLLNELHTFIKQKEYKFLNEVLEGKKPLRYVTVPKELDSVLDVIIGNELLKRDELAFEAKISKKHLANMWQLLKHLGLIVDSFKEDAKERVTYIFSSKRAKSIKTKIYQGAYDEDKELKSLWVN